MWRWVVRKLIIALILAGLLAITTVSVAFAQNNQARSPGDATADAAEGLDNTTRGDPGLPLPLP